MTDIERVIGQIEGRLGALEITSKDQHADLKTLLQQSTVTMQTLMTLHTPKDCPTSERVTMLEALPGKLALIEQERIGQRLAWKWIMGVAAMIGGLVSWLVSVLVKVLPMVQHTGK